MARRGRPKKSKDQKLKDALERNQPNIRVCQRQGLFAGLQGDRPIEYVIAPTGELRAVDQSHDTIGQLWLLGLFEGHGHDSAEMRNKGRFWGTHYAKLMKPQGVKTGSWERKDRSEPTGALTAADLLFDRMDAALGNGFERSALLSLVVDPLIGHRENVPWAQMFIDDELFKRGRFTACMVAGGVTENDRMLLNATIRGLCALVEGSLPGRYERRAAA